MQVCHFRLPRPPWSPAGHPGRLCTACTFSMRGGAPQQRQPRIVPLRRVLTSTTIDLNVPHAPSCCSLSTSRTSTSGRVRPRHSRGSSQLQAAMMAVGGNALAPAHSMAMHRRKRLASTLWRRQVAVQAAVFRRACLRFSLQRFTGMTGRTSTPLQHSVALRRQLGMRAHLHRLRHWRPRCWCRP